MKKTLLITAAIVLAGISSFAQGNVNFQGGLNQFKVDTNGVVAAQAGVNVTLLFSSTAVLPSVDGIAMQNAGSGTLGSSFVTNTTTFTIATAWSAILADANYFQVNGTNSPVSSILASSSSTGGWSYNAGSSFSAANVTGGNTYYAYVVAWIGSETTLAAAAAAGDALGWSQSFQYTPTTGVTGATSTGGVEGKFAVYAPIVATPEPSTMALAALGGASLLLFRRRK